MHTSTTTLSALAPLLHYAVREHVPAAIADCQRAGIAVRMLTGAQLVRGVPVVGGGGGCGAIGY